jgi:type III pantothenate kinase
MLLVIDVGNTNTVIGIFEGETLLKDWRIRTERNVTEDEFHVLIRSLLSGGGLEMKAVKKVVISCVVPPMVSNLDSFCRKYIGRSPHWVTAAGVEEMPILYTNPREVGADRIVNAVAAYRKYRTALVIIDFGTATTFDAISEKGEYMGGAISPGIVIASEALFQKASKLPRVELFERPKRVIGLDTIESIQSGLIFGYAGLVDGMVRRMVDEMGGNPRVIATGGLARLIQPISETVESVESNLTLEGLRIIGNNL